MGSKDQAELKAVLREIIGQRYRVEREVEEISTALNAPGKPGLSGSLVDKDGFPRADFDIPAVRASRQKLACLTNDHKTSRRLGCSTKPGPWYLTPGICHGGRCQASRRENASPMLRPREVTKGSPASEAGIRVGDQLCSFGDVVGDQLCRFGDVASASGTAPAPTSELMQRVAQSLGASEGGSVLMLVLRNGIDIVELNLHPRKWAGRGLLG
eukprot:gene16258-22434_t